MQIDWFTFIAQIVNFLILLGLLKHFLYGPIVAAMDEREARIAARLAEARHKREEAEQERVAFREERAKLAAQRDHLLAEAREAAKQQREALLDEAREEVDRLEARWRAALAREQDAFLHDVAQRTADQLLILARHALRDLANAELEEQVIDVFIERLQDLDEEERATFARTVRETGKPPAIRTRFELTDDARRRITQVWQERIGEDTEPTFETVPELGFGIEVKGGGLKVGWNLAGYLGTLEERISEALEDALKARRRNGPDATRSEEAGELPARAARETAPEAPAQREAKSVAERSET